MDKATFVYEKLAAEKTSGLASNVGRAIKSGFNKVVGATKGNKKMQEADKVVNMAATKEKDVDKANEVYSKVTGDTDTIVQNTSEKVRKPGIVSNGFDDFSDLDKILKAEKVELKPQVKEVELKSQVKEVEPKSQVGEVEPKSQVGEVEPKSQVGEVEPKEIKSEGTKAKDTKEDSILEKAKRLIRNHPYRTAAGGLVTGGVIGGVGGTMLNAGGRNDQ